MTVLGRLAIVAAASAIIPPSASIAAPASPFPLRHYTCTLGGQPCMRLPKTWSEQGPGGKSGGTNAIESIDLSYHYGFKATVTVYAAQANQPKQCTMKYSQHIDVSGGPDLGFYPGNATQPVSTTPTGLPMSTAPLDFYGNVSAHLVDAKIIDAWYGTGSVGFANVVDLYNSQSQDKLPCLWGGVDSRSIDGSITINYRKIVLYAPLPKPGPAGKLSTGAGKSLAPK